MILYYIKKFLSWVHPDRSLIIAIKWMCFRCSCSLMMPLKLPLNLPLKLPFKLPLKLPFKLPLKLPFNLPLKLLPSTQHV
ncbi:Os12g0574500 [Oryza sativa Japonica Group]|uniref:Os12g0574500 protein n=3 Tax=Oryza TaxID=4527 RepID=Q0IME5_ORYSJ|nr:Os12g0574500 [Oryza sativa Japonica Group]BAT17766.1 Os12g0574500 [Oryza sativa Japonica Group]|eukprot:NP_001067101.1 Os12g0574500 [Oryza sativa Japonica Group]